MTIGSKSLFKRLSKYIESNYGTFRGLIRVVFGEIEYLSGRLFEFTSLPSSRVERLVFVCLGNINRSAFASRVAQIKGANSISIGLSTTTGLPAFEKAIETANTFGIDLSGHRAKNFPDYSYEPGDLLVAMEVRHVREMVRRGIPKQSIVLLGHWGAPSRIHIHDPHTLSDHYFQTCFLMLFAATLHLLADLRTSGSPCIIHGKMNDNLL